MNNKTELEKVIDKVLLLLEFAASEIRVAISRDEIADMEKKIEFLETKLGNTYEELTS